MIAFLIAGGVSVIVGFALGWFWYGPMAFGPRWMALVGLTDEKVAQANMSAIMGMAFVYSAISVIGFGILMEVSGAQTLVDTLVLGAICGVGVSAMSISLNDIFAQRPFVLSAITSGYHIVRFALYGVIFGLIT